MEWRRFISLFSPAQLDRRVIYVSVFLALVIPMALKVSLPPARMQSADEAFQTIQTLEARKPVFISLDFGPNSLAENLPQAEVVVEHLFRLKIPIVFYSQYPLAAGFLEDVPTKIAQKLSNLGQGNFSYGADWVNIGYRPNPDVFLQGLAASDSWVQYLKRDARGNKLGELPLFATLKDLRDVQAVIQLSSLVGTLDAFLRFFQRADAHPKLIHGCTSITIPQAYIYLDSGQLAGLFEGVAGAAWYSKLLSDKFPGRPVDKALTVNTGLAIAHVVILFLVVLGNVTALFSRSRPVGGMQ